MLTLCEREGTTVPRFVKLCVDEVEKRGMAQKIIFLKKQMDVVFITCLAD